MSGYRRWRDPGHLECAIETVGGPEIFDDGVRRLRDQARGWRLAELHKRRGLTLAKVAERMGVSVPRVSQIENGDVSARDLMGRYGAAVGGILSLVADFGEEQLKVG